MRLSEPIYAIADDLTGAAEIAAIGHRMGWPARVTIGPAAEQEGTFTVMSTETRLASPEVAARVIATMAEPIAALREARIYKKVDSVMRGPVAAELVSLAGLLGKQTVLLVPNNPSQRRIIRGRRYFVDGIPLNETSFANDPHHPTVTSDVLELLGGTQSTSVWSPTGEALPGGIVIGESASADDLAAWARRIDHSVLPAGGAEFFEAVATGLGWKPVRPTATETVIEGPTLWICGSTAPAGRLRCEQARKKGVPLFAMPPTDQLSDSWIGQIEGAVGRSGLVIIVAPQSTGEAFAGPASISAAFGRVARRVIEGRIRGHLMLEGGATAAAVVVALGWNRLTVRCEWAPGVVSLTPDGVAGFTTTIKPGSYRWPDSLLRAVNCQS